MHIIRGWHNVRPQHYGCVLTMGNFDGMHLGHQALLKQLKTAAYARNLPATVMIFEPQPNEFFHYQQQSTRLMRLREKLESLQAINIDQVIIVQFNQAFSQVTATDFVQKYLIQQLGVKHIVIGDDFHFGYKRQGDINTLMTLGHTLGFTIEPIDTLLLNHERVSSTRVRTALIQGDLNGAAKLLGRPFSMSGRVAHGDKLGRTIGFPTANIFCHRLHVPITGVIAVRVHGIDNKIYNGVANVGNRPTVGGETVLLEVYIFDFDRIIYGQHVQVEFVQKIRDEIRFDTVEAMRIKIVEDVQIAKQILSTTSQK